MEKRLVIIGWWFGWLRSFYNLSWNKELKITLIDKRTTSSMKPALPEVSFEWKNVAETRFEIRWVVESNWGIFINDEVKLIKGDENKLELKSWDVIEYDFLIVAPGANKAYSDIKWLEEFSYSMCDDKHAPKLWEALKNFKSWKILIWAAKSVWWNQIEAMKWEAPCEWPIWEAMYMIDHYLRKKWIRESVDIKIFAPGPVFRWDAPNLHDSRWMPVFLDHVVSEIKEKSVVFENWKELESDLTIIIPPYKWFQFLIDSNLADEKWMLLTDKVNMRHIKYKNIFWVWDINTVTMPKLWHICVMEADIVSANLKNEVWENVEIPKFEPEILCIMNMWWYEASVFLTDKAFSWKNHVFWYGKWQGILKRQFDFYNMFTKGKMPPKFWEHFIKRAVKTFWKWETDKK